MQQMANGPSKAKHVAVFVFPFASHPSAVLSIVRRLAAESPPDTLFSFFNTATSNKSISATLGASNEGTLSTNNIKFYDLNDGIPEGHILSNSNPQEAVDFYLKVATVDMYKKSVDYAVELSGGRMINCVLSDALAPFAAELVADLNVPWVCFWMSSVSALAAHVFTDQIRDKFGLAGIAGREDETLDFIPGLSEVRASDLQVGILEGKLESPFAQMLHRMGRTIPQTTTLAINSFEGLEPSITNYLKPMFNNFVHIGPTTITTPQQSITLDVHGCVSWLDKQEKGSVAYISFGTIFTPPPHELVPLAEAIEATGVPFLWSIKDHMKNHLPEGILKSGKGKLVPWAPQREVLNHDSIGVFVTHFGWHSVLESVVAGVPMVGRPYFGDHGHGKRNVESLWKIGVGVKGCVFTKSGTIEALEQVLSSDEGVKMRENVRVLKQAGMKAIGPTGSSVANIKRLLEI